MKPAANMLHSPLKGVQIEHMTGNQGKSYAFWIYPVGVCSSVPVNLKGQAYAKI
jgi:hypothetical protein